MEDQEDVQPQKNVNHWQTESLKYQLDLLKIEIQAIDRIFARLDEITQTTKNWALVVWAGSIAIALGQPDLRKYIALTATLPLLFWYIDAFWRRLQRRSGFRARKIHEFLNDGRLAKSFEQNKLVSFTVYDPTGLQYRNTEEYKRSISIRRTLKYREVSVFYLVLTLLSLGFGVFFIFVP